MRVLLLGGGGREHAIGWKISQSPLLTELISCPGNPGLAELGRIETDTDPNDPAAVVSFATRESVDLVIIGPEAPLAAGVADALRETGIDVFGPGADGARLEASKSFANEVMDAAGVPTAGSETFTDLDATVDYLNSYAGPYVVKADGLAAGKGVLVTSSRRAAIGWAEDCLGGRFGEAGASVVIEEFMEGDELSVFFLCADGVAVPFEPARDYKRLLEGDDGPNTGGMGSYSPVPDLPQNVVEWTTAEVAIPTLAELSRRGIDYTGFLYVGLMLTDTGPRVVEFNCRLGDPETQALMPRLASDLLGTIATGLQEGFADTQLEWTDTATVNVVLAANGYPSAPRKGDRIEGLAQPDGSLVFHAGTRIDATGQLVTSGGRVVNIVGMGATIQQARQRTYDTVRNVTFDGCQYRTDIAKREESQ